MYHGVAWHVYDLHSCLYLTLNYGRKGFLFSKNFSFVHRWYFLGESRLTSVSSCLCKRANVDPCCWFEIIHTLNTEQLNQSLLTPLENKLFPLQYLWPIFDLSDLCEFWSARHESEQRRRFVHLQRTETHMIYDVCTDQTQSLYLIHGHGCLYNVHSSICNQYRVLQLDWSPINLLLFPLMSRVEAPSRNGSKQHTTVESKNAVSHQRLHISTRRKTVCVMVLFSFCLTCDTKTNPWTTLKWPLLATWNKLWRVRRDAQLSNFGLDKSSQAQKISCIGRLKSKHESVPRHREVTINLKVKRT